MAQKKYDFKKIEKKWQKVWGREKTYEPDIAGAKRPFYNLMMFPYPSAEGLHIGGVRTFTGIDIFGRYKRMCGYDVLEPIGLDGFGIHSENFALKVDRHPMDHAKISEKNFYRQLAAMGNGFSWDERLETYAPEYYKWTQWVFIQLFKAGLAYRKKQAVNWCPSCKTVLSDEQAEGGKCERCASAVEKKELEQWFFKITDYAERLLENIEKLDWSDKVRIAQRNWIGKKEGINITYPIVIPVIPAKAGIQAKDPGSRIPPSHKATEGHGESGMTETVTVFTTRPDTNFGATFVVLAPESELIAKITTDEHKDEVERYVAAATAKSEDERIAAGRAKTGAFTGRYAINHLTGKRMPIWVSDFVLGGFGTGAVVGVPGHDIRDFEFAKVFKLEIIRVVVGSDGDASPITKPEQVQEEEGTMIHSGFLDGMDIHKATRAIMDHMEEKGWGKRITTYRLRDWLISRQRYWGPPIPMIFCEACAAAEQGEQKNMPGWYAVPDKDLPVKLPYVKNFKPMGTGKSPLASVKSFYETRCPFCGGKARRETDVSDTFLDSAWYFLRYPSVRDKKHAWDPAITKKWLPVHSYIGGAEHSVLHLLYSRFVTMAMHDMKLLDFEEPFTRFRAHGLITKDGAKMSKSKGNVVNPDEYIEKFGSDVVRMYLAFLAPLEQGGDFRAAGIVGIERFLQRVWKLCNRDPKYPNSIRMIRNSEHSDKFAGLNRLTHRTIRKVGEDIEGLRFNTAISSLMVLLNEFEANIDVVSKEHLSIFMRLLAPFAPHMAEEIWQRLQGQLADKRGQEQERTCLPAGRDKRGKDLRQSASSRHISAFKSVHLAPWPTFDPALLVDDTFMLVVQVNGKVRDSFEAPLTIAEKEATLLALAREKVKTHIGAGKPKKIIFVPKRLINIVI